MKQTLLRTPPKTSRTEGQPQQGYRIRGTILRPPLQPDWYHRACSDIKPTAARGCPLATALHSLARLPSPHSPEPAPTPPTLFLLPSVLWYLTLSGYLFTVSPTRPRAWSRNVVRVVCIAITGTQDSVGHSGQPEWCAEQTSRPPQQTLQRSKHSHLHLTHPTARLRSLNTAPAEEVQRWAGSPCTSSWWWLPPKRDTATQRGQGSTEPLQHLWCFTG